MLKIKLVLSRWWPPVLPQYPWGRIGVILAIKEFANFVNILTIWDSSAILTQSFLARNWCWEVKKRKKGKKGGILLMLAMAKISDIRLKWESNGGK